MRRNPQQAVRFAALVPRRGLLYGYAVCSRKWGDLLSGTLMIKVFLQRMTDSLVVHAASHLPDLDAAAVFISFPLQMHRSRGWAGCCGGGFFFFGTAVLWNPPRSRPGLMGARAGGCGTPPPLFPRVCQTGDEMTGCVLASVLYTLYDGHAIIYAMSGHQNNLFFAWSH